MRLAYAFGFDVKSLLYRDAIVCQTALLTPTEATALYFDGRYGWRLILYFLSHASSTEASRWQNSASNHANPELNSGFAWIMMEI